MKEILEHRREAKKRERARQAVQREAQETNSRPVSARSRGDAEALILLAEASKRQGISLPRPGRLLGRTLGLVGRVALKLGVTRRIMLTVVGVLATVILISALLAVVLLER